MSETVGKCADNFMSGELGAAQCEKREEGERRENTSDLIAHVPGISPLPWEVPRSIAADTLESCWS
jgi:hypothetical protein